MKSLKVKFVKGCGVFPAHPQVKIGDEKHVAVREVVNIPDDVPAAKVISAINRCAWIKLPSTIDYTTLKPGTIIR